MAIQYESSQFNYLYDHAWMVQLHHILLSDCHLSGDQNEVFESLVLQSLLSTANFR